MVWKNNHYALLYRIKETRPGAKAQQGENHSRRRNVIHLLYQKAENPHPKVRVLAIRELGY
jgi:hypothetical protein